MKTNEIKNQLQQLRSKLVRKAIELTSSSTKKLEPFLMSNECTAIGYGDSFIIFENDDNEKFEFEVDRITDSDLLELISQLEDDVEQTEFYIPVKWESFGIVSIKANSLKDAIDIFERTKETIPLPEHRKFKMIVLM